MLPPSGPAVLAALLAGAPSLHDPDQLPEPWRPLAAAVLAASDAGRVAAFEAALATRPDAHTLRAAVFTAGPSELEHAIPRVWPHNDLLRTDFPPRTWIVEGIIPSSSLVLLGGKKKLGKSWLCLQLAQAIALGAPVLGRPTTKMSVLYLCLEDGEARVKSRLEQQHAHSDIPGLDYCFGPLPPLDRDGLAVLESLIAGSRPGLLILDTLAAAKSGRSDENAAGTMGDILNPLHALAQQQQCTILVVAHHGKTIRTHDPSGADAGDDIRGSSAIGAASDINLGLYRSERGFILRGEGKDIEELALQLHFDRELTFAWQLVGDARQAARQDADRDLVEALESLVEADAGAIARELGRDRRGLARRLKRLVAGGGIQCRTTRTNHGAKILYRLVDEDQAT